jgi:hypothetical protein
MHPRKLLAYFGMPFYLEPSTQYQVSLQAYSEDWESLVETKTIKTGNEYNEDEFDQYFPVTGLEAQPIKYVMDIPSFSKTCPCLTVYVPSYLGNLQFLFL